MARKQLIKGANASRLEERIANVPVDVPETRDEASAGIFGALKAMEEKAVSEGEGRAAEGRAKAARIGPSDFNSAEREAIIRCCTDYRNRMPTYLLSSQAELRTIDSVIEKCRSTKAKRKP